MNSEEQGVPKEDGDYLTREGMSDVRANRMVDHQTVETWKKWDRSIFSRLAGFGYKSTCFSC
ncbi:MAG: hypothetical protein JAY64_16420 [Candidatus Thiodiazotropha weberae]|nr:hypothetical protein [Candidatus Thiodiazotropha lotti]MCG8013268.1 hypothetical protein [Candidatus Thiodiazotropha lotti]MCW4212741.1 hypothetical protein [Candidatus Thiodiazotropha lotti]MCW4216562.1 hypothetical protein [Candidatus Thiodiazotropha lotti]